MATFPSIDHGILSPSGRCSKRAREAALKREADRLFQPGTFDVATPSEAQQRADKVAGLLRTAAHLRALAERGMRPIAYRREARKLEAEAQAMGGAL